jgi:hypothetical protein
MPCEFAADLYRLFVVSFVESTTHISAFVPSMLLLRLVPVHMPIL